MQLLDIYTLKKASEFLSSSCVIVLCKIILNYGADIPLHPISME